MAERRADIAALDALTWQLIRRFDDFAADLVEIGCTAPSPALPFITARGRDPAPLRAALRGAVAAMSAADRTLLGLRGIVELPQSAYLAMPLPPAP